jgi:hypothetical protein
MFILLKRSWHLYVTAYYYYYYYYYLLALQPYVDLGLLHGFLTVNFYGVRSLAPRPNPSLVDQGLSFVWPLTFDLCDMDLFTRSLRSRQHSSLGHWGAWTTSPRQGGSPRGGTSKQEVLQMQTLTREGFVHFGRDYTSPVLWGILITPENSQ